jgi:hypothetical protein
VHRGEALRERAVGAHRQHRARTRQEGGDQARRTGSDDGEEEEQVQWAAEDWLGQRAEHVVGDRLVPQPESLGADAGVHLRGDGDQQIRQQDRHHAEQSRAARDLLRLLGLLVDRQARVPSPEGEDRPGQAGHECGEGQAGRAEPVEAEAESGLGVAGLDECDQREDQQQDQLEAHEHELDHLRGGDAAVRDPGGDGEKGQAGQDVDQLVLPQRPEIGLFSRSPRNW